MALVTIDPSLDGEPIEDVANTIYREWGVGKKGKDEGILLLLAVKDRKNRLEVGYGLEPILPDGFVGSVLREMRPALQEGNYGQALLAAARRNRAADREVEGRHDRAHHAPARAAGRGRIRSLAPDHSRPASSCSLLIAQGRRRRRLPDGAAARQYVRRSRYRGGGGGGWGGGGFGGGDSAAGSAVSAAAIPAAAAPPATGKTIG